MPDFDLIRSALKLDEQVPYGNAGPLAALAQVEQQLAAAERRANDLADVLRELAELDRPADLMRQIARAELERQEQPDA